MGKPSILSRVQRFCAAGLVAFSTAVPLLWSTPAAADFRVCNTTPSPINVAIGYRDGTVWTTEGWWRIPANGCTAIVSGPLQSRYYYVYAVDDDRGGAWTGNAFMCTRDLMFTIHGIEDCVARGYDRTGFVEIDTNLEPNWLVYLTEENRQGVGGR
jgi:uncharacterized membrane protein